MGVHDISLASALARFDLNIFSFVLVVQTASIAQHTPIQQAWGAGDICRLLESCVYPSDSHPCMVSMTKSVYASSCIDNRTAYAPSAILKAQVFEVTSLLSYATCGAYRASLH